jgi:hypothetical protein
MSVKSPVANVRALPAKEKEEKLSALRTIRAKKIVTRRGVICSGE